MKKLLDDLVRAAADHSYDLRSMPADVVVKFARQAELLAEGARNEARHFDNSKRHPDHQL